MNRRPTTVLVVDDEISVTDILYEDLTGEGYDCITAGTGGDALQHPAATHRGVFVHVEVAARDDQVGAESLRPPPTGERLRLAGRGDTG